MACLRNRIKQGVLLDGRYKTMNELNRGSFGWVFDALDLETNDIVAIKCLSKPSAAAFADPDDVQLAVDENSEELTLHSRLGRHLNIVNLLRSFETDSHVYLVLECCPRGDLYEAIKQGKGPLETSHVRRFMNELLDAVAYMHSRKVYHRDIKPENIFLTESGSMKLGDFGLATTEVWSYESAVGSDRYMSPEQYGSGDDGYSPAAADIWAIGVCLLNILFQRNPFILPSHEDAIFQDYVRDRQSLFDVFPTMSQDTFEVISHCMHLDPAKRSIDATRRALDRVVSFTTLDEVWDDFASAARIPEPTSNREPLRTPSVQPASQHDDSFPWAHALQSSPHAPRQLSAIPDSETYTEDLFSKSHDHGSDWFSGSVATATSFFDSNFGTSVASNRVAPAVAVDIPSARAADKRKVSPAASSLPIRMSRPRPAKSIESMSYGRGKIISTSWADMFEEEMELEKLSHADHGEALMERGSAVWSNESHSGDHTPRQGVVKAIPALDLDTENVPPEELAIATVPSADFDDDDLMADGFFFQHASPRPAPEPKPIRYETPRKRSVGGVDKWAALGERRRAFANDDRRKAQAPFSSPIRPVSRSTPRSVLSSARNAYAGVSVPVGPHHTSAHKALPAGAFASGHSPSPAAPHATSVGFQFSGYTIHNYQTVNKWNAARADRGRGCPWNQGRDWHAGSGLSAQRRHDKRAPLADAEWYGELPQLQSLR